MYSDRRAKRDALGIKTLKGLLHDIRMSFLQERIHTGCHIITSVIRNRNLSLMSRVILLTVVSSLLTEARLYEFSRHLEYYL